MKILYKFSVEIASSFKLSLKFRKVEAEMSKEKQRLSRRTDIDIENTKRYLYDAGPSRTPTSNKGKRKKSNLKVTLLNELLCNIEK